MDVSAHHLSYSIGAKQIIDDVSFHLPRGCLMGIMSASGGGKTTLMTLLSGRHTQLPRPQEGTIEGKITLNGHSIAANDPSLTTFLDRRTGFVVQDDIMIETLTPRELLRYRAELSLPAATTREFRRGRVEKVLKNLGLMDCADIPIGTPGLKKGISGGQRKRLNIGLTLLESPTLLFCDEASSGLDSKAALSLIRTLSHLAKRDGITILLSIHQPSIQMFAYFDQLLLLAKGKTMYYGPANTASSHFASLGYQMPISSNPPEFFISLLETPPVRGTPSNNSIFPKLKEIELHDIDTESGDDVLGDDEKSIIHGDKLHNVTSLDIRHNILRARLPKISPFPSTPSSSVSSGSMMSFPTLNNVGGSATRPNSFRRTWILTRRTYLSLLRDPTAFTYRLIVNTVLYLLVGFIYWKLDNTQSGVLDRFGGLFMVLMYAIADPIFAVTAVIPKERVVFLREVSDSLYNPVEYLISKVVMQCTFEAAFAIYLVQLFYWSMGLQNSAERFFSFLFAYYGSAIGGVSLAIFLTCAFESVEAAVSSGTGFTVLMILFCNYLIRVENIPAVLRWITWINPLNYAINIVAVNELTGLEFYCAPSEFATAPNGQSYCPINNGKEAMAFFKLNSSLSIPVQFVILFGLSIAGIIFSAWILVAPSPSSVWNSCKRMCSRNKKQ